MIERRTTLLIGAVLVVAVALVVQSVGPCALPASVVEGRLVQQTTETSAIVVWYTSEPTRCTFVYTTPDGTTQSAPVETVGTRHSVHITGLEPDREYAYEVRRGDTKLVQARLRSNKPAGSAFHFVVLGDSGADTQAQYAIGARMAALKPDFVLHTGDVIYPAGERRHYAVRFFDPYRRLLSEVSFWPAPGNHDESEESLRGDPYREVFELPTNGPADQPPESSYWFDYADARIAIVDSNLEKGPLRASIAPWLRKVMSAPEPKWRFVVLHHPPYTASRHPPAARIRAALVPVFEEVGVDVAFSGHNHLYERTLPMRRGEAVESGPGIVYVVSGAGGAALYPSKPEQPAYIAKAVDSVHSFTHVSIDGPRLHLTQISVDGQILDDWTSTKDARAVPSEPVGTAAGGRRPTAHERNVMSPAHSAR